MRKHLATGLIMCSLVLACGEPVPEAGREAGYFPAFSGFPQRQFYEISFGQDKAAVEKQLDMLGFEKTDSSGAITFVHQADSMSFILPDKDPVTAFKVFLRSGTYLDQRTGLLNLFERSASTTSTRDSFTIYHYESDACSFKLTAFSQPGYLRLGFEQDYKP